VPGHLTQAVSRRGVVFALWPLAAGEPLVQDYKLLVLHWQGTLRPEQPILCWPMHDYGFGFRS
jgi:hypothetical protein